MSDILDSIDVNGDNADDFGDDLDELDFDDEGTEGEVVDFLSSDDLEIEMSEAKARELTDAIRAAATATYVLLARAHEGKAYKALGYDTWADYVRNEFDITASRSYQLLDLSKVVREIEEATPDGTVVTITEAQARDIKRELPQITERIKAEVSDDPEEAAGTVERIIEDIRDQKKADEKAIQEREQKLSEAEQDGYHRGLEAAGDAFLDRNPEEGGERRASDGGEYGDPDAADGMDVMSPQDKVDLYNFLNVLSGLSSLPEPDEFIKIIPNGREDEITNQLDAAATWINRMASLWEVHTEGE